ncbi:c-type cytochrome, partial [Bacillus velezensis]|uniref:c-type cytochrome n=1 Tax=Bacillus velezensis TaxID=492670 RepID=UPI0020BE4DBA
PVDKNDDSHKLMQKNTCLTCHRDNLQGGAAAPALQNLTLKPEEFAKIEKDGKGAMPKGIFKGTDEDLKKLSE